MNKKTTAANQTTIYGSASWMSSLADYRKLSSISIPGTHDSGALHDPWYWRDTAKCQDLSIAEQLQAGVRFLDIRCCNVQDKFEIYHGWVDQQLTFDAVLQDCSSFLTENPSEVIIMSVKEEQPPQKCTRSFEDTFDSYYKNNTALWYLGTDIPVLGAVRGKIVLLRRFTATHFNPRGIDASPDKWQDNKTFKIDDGTTTLYIQDQYNCTADDYAQKEQAIVFLWSRLKLLQMISYISIIRAALSIKRTISPVSNRSPTSSTLMFSNISCNIPWADTA